MVTNLMENYLKIKTEFIKNFTKMFFLNDYNDEISNEYMSAYIDSRVYNYAETYDRFFYRRIYSVLLNKKKEIQQAYKNIDEKALDDNLKIYQYIFYLDGVRPLENLENFCESICEKRVLNFGLSTTRGLATRIIKLVKNYKEKKEEFFKRYETDIFKLNIEKFILIEDTYKVTLDYNFKIPYIYSHQVIQEVFNQGTINEDRLIIEYILLTIKCIKDIENGNFQTKYIVDFPNSLYKKQNKLNQTLRIINNPAIQDKVFLKINFKDIEENKELLYSLIREGFKFAIIINSDFNFSMVNLKKLSIFNYLLVNKDSENYEKIKNIETELGNTVIYVNDI